jgi:hypothetical protein
MLREELEGESLVFGSRCNVGPKERKFIRKLLQDEGAVITSLLYRGSRNGFTTK